MFAPYGKVWVEGRTSQVDVFINTRGARDDVFLNTT